MSIVDLRQALCDLPGAHTLTMEYRYIGGVSHELFRIGDKEALVQSPATPEKVRAALKDCV